MSLLSALTFQLFEDRGFLDIGLGGIEIDVEAVAAVLLLLHAADQQLVEDLQNVFELDVVNGTGCVHVDKRKQTNN